MIRHKAANVIDTFDRVKGCRSVRNNTLCYATQAYSMSFRIL